MKNIFITLCVSYVFMLSWGWAYFEEQYVCSIDKNVIEVSLTAGEAVCFTYIAQVSTAIDELNQELIQANKYLDQWRDKAYWTKIYDELRLRRDNMVNLRTQVIAAVDDYEIELFLKVKPIVAAYLIPRRQKVLNKIVTADKLLVSLKEAGDAETYGFVVKQAEKLQQQLILYDRIRFASTFMELIPPLKLYIQSWWFELDSINDKPDSANIT